MLLIGLYCELQYSMQGIKLEFFVVKQVELQWGKIIQKVNKLKDISMAHLQQLSWLIDLLSYDFQKEK
jgi:hypothetical protein